MLSQPCLQAPGCRNDQGYARVTVVRGRRQESAHRAAYQAAHGPIPAGCVVDHLCHNADPTCPAGPACLHRGCIEPTHLEATDHATNVVRGKGDRRTHCKDGHELTEANTYYIKSRIRSRKCRICTLASNRAWRATRRARSAGHHPRKTSEYREETAA